MKRALAALLLVISGAALDRLSFVATQQAEAGVKVCARANGDVNADGRLDIGDAVTVLGHLFLGQPSELVSLCGLDDVRPG